MRGENPPWRDAFLVEAVRDDEVDRPPFKAVRTADRSYVEYGTGAKELYDLSEDPHQLENLAGERPDEQAALKARLEALRNCSGNSCRAAEGD